MSFSVSLAIAGAEDSRGRGATDAAGRSFRCFAARLPGVGLFGSDATIELTVDREMVVPGDEIRVSATVSGEPDEKVRGGRIELACRNEYKIETRDPDGDRRVSNRA